MLLIPECMITVSKSQRHGLGLFAAHRIEVGVDVVRWSKEIDFLLSPREWDALPPGLRRLLDPICWLEDDGYHYGTSGLGRFINHSKTPNLAWNPYTRAMATIVPIEKGDEITEDYAAYDRAFSTYAASLID